LNPDNRAATYAPRYATKGTIDMTALARLTPAASLKRAIIAVFAALTLSSCGINSVPTAEEQVNAAWGNLQADYQRRADLIPNLVATVKGYAQQEKTVLVQVTQARADATAVHLSAADLSDPAKVQAFNDAQSRLSQAIIPLQRLQEAYPDLKSNQNFLALQDQLEGTENRIEASRRDYNTSVQQYNTLIRTFPTAVGAKIFYGAKPKVPFAASSAAQQAPTVTFNAS
jgi:LemA protein